MHQLLHEIENKLPELAWKTSLLPPYMNLSLLPKNLFVLSIDNHPSNCVNEIKKDLARLSGIKEHNQGYVYLVKKIEQKVEVLIRLCQLQTKRQVNKSESARLVLRFSGRRQWVEELEQTINDLKHQHYHLKTKFKEHNELQVQLAIKADLGLLEKKITTLQEKLKNLTTF